MRMSDFLASAFLLISFSAQAVTVQIDYVTVSGEPSGFNIADPVAQAERRAAFERAVEIWATQLDGSITLNIRAFYEGGVGPGFLGAGSPTTASANLSGLPFSSTFYYSALASQLVGISIPSTVGDTAGYHMEIVFNDFYNSPPSGNDSWTYDLDNPPASNEISFLTTATHELGHAFGVFSLVNLDPLSPSNPGGWANLLVAYPILTGPTPLPFGDIYSKFLTRTPAGGGPNDQDYFDMSDAERLAASTSDEVYFNGTNVMSAAEFTPPPAMPAPLLSVKGEVQVYATSTSGENALGHWDFGHVNDLLMKPGIPSGFELRDIDATRELMKDLGWTLTAAPAAGSLAVVYVDFDFLGEEYGTQALPVNTTSEAVNLVVPSGTVNIIAGTSDQTLTINKEMTVQTVGGVVTIGAP